jgi:hypothetical protein
MRAWPCPHERSSATCLRTSGGLWRTGPPDDPRHGEPGRPGRVSQATCCSPQPQPSSWRSWKDLFEMDLIQEIPIWRKSAVAATLIRTLTACSGPESNSATLPLPSVLLRRSGMRSNHIRKERPRRAMHCEWAVLAYRVRLHGPVTGPPTRSPEVPGFGALQRSRDLIPMHGPLRGSIRPCLRASPGELRGWA